MRSKIVLFIFSALCTTAAFGAGSPEEVIQNFVDQLRTQNISGMADCFFDNYTDKLTTEQIAKISGGVIPAFPTNQFSQPTILPNEYKIFRDINRINQTALIYRQIYNFAFLTTAPQITGRTRPASIESEFEVDSFISDIDPGKLGDAKIVDATNPFDEETQKAFESNAQNSPQQVFDKINNRLVLIKSKERTFAVPFVLAKKEGQWKILALGVSSGSLLFTTEIDPRDFEEKFVSHKLHIDKK